MIKILSIGNSFSSDAHRYLSRVAAEAGIEMQTLNLYIGGCSLKMHYENLIGNRDLYEYEPDGESGGTRHIAIKEALGLENWDYVTLQQASALSVDYGTYQPYLSDLALYVRKACPDSKLLLHRTWSYENGSERLCREMGYAASSDMFADISRAYDRGAADIRADGMIPAGDAMQIAADRYGLRVHRDTFHASLGAGRYILALTWLSYICGYDVGQSTFRDFEEPVTVTEAEYCRAAVKDAVRQPRG